MESTNPMRPIRHYIILALLTWTLICATGMFYIYQTGKQQVLLSAKIAARTSIDKDVAYRHWVAAKGGIYAAISRNTPPNPYLIADEREITTPSGRQLTLVNPAYMTRQVFEQEFKLATSIKSHITSLKPLRPENKPDLWETEALTSIAQGAADYGTRWQHEKTPAYRYLRPLITETACLRCHADQGYKVGDIRGGISVIIPLKELLIADNHLMQQVSMAITSIWLVGLFGIMFSCRKIVKATTNLQHERDNVQLLFESAPHGMLLFNRAGKILEENTAVRNMYSGTESHHGKRLGDIFNCKNVQKGSHSCAFSNACQMCPICEASKAALDRHLVTSSKECSIQGIDPAIPPLTFLFSVAPLQFNGEDGALLVFVNITEQKTAEQERKKIAMQLSQAQKIESIGLLAGGVAHDFNNMLAIISGNVELALRKLDSKISVKNHLCQIRETANRSADLTRQLLGFARKQTIEPKVLNLNAAIDNMLNMLRRLIGEDIELIWKPAPFKLKLFIDPSQLDQILTNLIVNARDAIENVGSLALSTDSISIDAEYCQAHPWSKIGEYVHLSVSDDGCGMTREVSEHIFEPFFTTKDTNKGTGLGLATVYGIVKQNKGFISAYSELGQGTTFHIYLPQSNAPVPGKTLVYETVSARRGETVLLVEDEEKLLGICQQLLEGAGYQVIASREPLMALQLATDHNTPIDLLLTDVIMPKLNGRELAERLLVARPGVKVVYMSGYTADIVSARGLLEEGVHLLRKPFTTETLTRKLREVLDS